MTRLPQIEKGMGSVIRKEFIEGAIVLAPVKGYS
tara:strand:- start:233 stop:334 length:102 start_codon:yes stop_codon:yes gene_type:complete